MDEDAGGGGGSAREPPLLECAGGRQRFTVELRPGETTIVSWKKLLKDAARASGGPSTSSPSAAGGGGASQPPPPPNAHPVLETRLAPGQPAENELKDGHPSRFGAVIEKIERLYMGKHSSDEEDLNDVPDDDEYDTEDSFIDDTELDDYFQVDNSAIKHDGFFVNRGKLERINEPASLSNQQTKKRRRKDLVSDHGNGDNGQLPNKLVKVGNKPAGNSKKLVGRNVGLPHVVALPSVHNEDMKFQNQTNTSVVSAKKKSTETKQKSTETKISLDPSISSGIPNSDAALSLMGNADGRIPELLSSKTLDNKLKDGVETANAPAFTSHEESALAQSKSEPAILLNSSGELDRSVGREKDRHRERPDLNVYAGKIPLQNTKTLVMPRTDGSIIKQKSTNLEKTIGELERMVAESRPPSTEVQDADITSQAVKRRLPRELKQKLAKVARLAQASHGRIPKELINRLMSILGHLVQERTLKRNLKDMVTMGLTAKKEKDDRVQQMKKDVAELIRMRVPYIKSKVLEQQAGSSDDFQDMGNEEKEAIKRKYGMDNAIEDKICDIYDLYVDGLDEEAGPQARKLYAELANLWPKGFMDNHGIKRAVYRAKERKRASYGRNKDQEKIKRKKLVPKTEGTAPVDIHTVTQPQHMQEKSVSVPNNYASPSANKSVHSIASTKPSVGPASSTPSGPNPERPKQDKVKAKGSSINLNEKAPMDVLPKKKVKRKSETELVGGQVRSEKPVSIPGDEKSKSHNKQAVASLQKPSLPSSAMATTKAVSPPINLNNPADMR